MNGLMLDQTPFTQPHRLSSLWPALTASTTRSPFDQAPISFLLPFQHQRPIAPIQNPQSPQKSPNMSGPAIPPGSTIVQTFRQSFVDVPIDADKDNAISTTEFLDAAESLVTIFGA